ncbi:MAG: hypothetical protein AABW73_02360 [Nanoarchaeota archaeon]
MIMFKQNDDKKGIIRIIESFLAILLILGATVLVFSRFTDNNLESQSISSNEKAIMEQLANNAELRGIIINTDVNNDNGVATSVDQKIIDFVSKRVQAGYEYEIKICKLESICASSSYHEQVFAEERVISSNINDYSPRKIKIYEWKTGTK